MPSHVRGGRWLLVDASARSALIEHLLRNQPYRVYSQRRDRSIIWDVAGQRPYTHVRPDVVVETRAPERRRLAIDAKYKVYDERRLSAGDVYQAFLYAYAYGDHDDRLPASLLLYPATLPASEQTHLAVRSQYGKRGADIRALGVHIPSALREVRESGQGRVSAVLREAVERAFAVGEIRAANMSAVGA